MNDENQICLIPLRLSFILMYGIMVGHIIPVTVLNIIYLKLVRYVHEMNKRVIPANVLARVKRELIKMVRNIVTIAIVLLYTIFILMSCFTGIPKYHYCIICIFNDASTTIIIIVLFKIIDAA